MGKNESSTETLGNRDCGWLRRADQAMIAVILVLSSCVMAASILLPGWRHGGVIDLETADPTSVEFVADVNSASWPELSLLPGVGEVLAQRIVASREQDGPFVDLDSLLRVEGIGPKKLAAIRPYLQPLPNARDMAGHPPER